MSQTNNPAINIVIPGEPTAKGRARSMIMRGKGKSWVHHYTPAKTRDYETGVAAVGARAMHEAQQLPFESGFPLEAEILVFKGIPKSWSKKKQAAAESGELRPTSKPDTDNYAKSILDGLNNVAYADDSQVVDLVVRKRYARVPRVEISIRKSI